MSWNSETYQTVRRNWFLGGSASKWKIPVGGGPNYCSGNHYEWVSGGIFTESGSARKAGRILDVPHSSIRSILYGVLHFYPYYNSSPCRSYNRETHIYEEFYEWAMARIESEPQLLFNTFWTDEAHYTLHGERERCQHPKHFFSFWGPVSLIGLETVNSNHWALSHIFCVMKSCPH